MTPEQRELFRIAILRVLDNNNTRFGLGGKAIAHHLPIYGFSNADSADIKSEVQYWTDKGHVGEVLKGVSPENRCFRITSAGRDYIATITNE